MQCKHRLALACPDTNLGGDGRQESKIALKTARSAIKRSKVLNARHFKAFYAGSKDTDGFVEVDGWKHYMLVIATPDGSQVAWQNVERSDEYRPQYAEIGRAHV